MSMYTVYGFEFDNFTCGTGFVYGGIGTAIGRAMSIGKLTESKGLKVRCIARKRTFDEAVEILRDCMPHDGRLVFDNGIVLDRISDRRDRYYVKAL